MTRNEIQTAKPILFNTEMVKAILDGRKTVTRRVIKSPAEVHECSDGISVTRPKNYPDEYCRFEPYCPIKVGDILYVRETWFYEEHMHDVTAGKPDLPSGRYSFRYIYKASEPDYPVDVGVGTNGWRPSIHMPKEAARIFLRVTDVRVERLQDIDDDGIVAEGLEIGAYFDELWNSTVKKSNLDKYGWNANPWVWVIEFERVEVQE